MLTTATSRHKRVLAGLCALTALTSLAQAHVSYTGRNLGTYSAAGSLTIANQVVTSNFGWASGTDANLGDSHRLRAFRFTLNIETDVTITVTASTNGGAAGVLGDLTPGFSIYQGLAHLSPAPADYDFSTVSGAWASTVVPVGVTPDGNFNALSDWKMGNDDGVTFADLSSFTYQGHAVDGTATNYGGAAGILGDGAKDGTVSGTFHLQPGDYSVFIGGAELATQNAGPFSNYGLTTSISVVPEPAASALGAVAGGLALLRRRRSSAARGPRLRTGAVLAGVLTAASVAQAQATADTGLKERQDKGKVVFATCAACHGLDGKGLPTSPPMAPALVGSKLATGPAEVATTIVLKGIQKTDTTFIGMMLPLAATFTDDQLADVLTYVRTSLNSSSAIGAEDVKKWREKYKDIATPMSRTTYEKKAELLKTSTPAAPAPAPEPAK